MAFLFVALFAVGHWVVDNTRVSKWLVVSLWILLVALFVLLAVFLPGSISTGLSRLGVVILSAVVYVAVYNLMYEFNIKKSKS